MLTGKLVRLRRYDQADLDRVLGWINDREVTQWIAARYPASRAEEQEWLDRAMKRPPSEGLTLAIETLAEARHIGSIGLDRHVAENADAELGIMIGEKDCWSHGYGSDAVLTLLGFAFDEMNLHRVELTVLDGNERASACYRKCGFVEEGRKRDAWFQAGRYYDLVLMSVLAEEFRVLHGPTA